MHTISLSEEQAVGISLLFDCKIRNILGVERASCAKAQNIRCGSSALSRIVASKSHLGGLLHLALGKCSVGSVEKYTFVPEQLKGVLAVPSCTALLRLYPTT